MSTDVSRALVHRYYDEFFSAPDNLDIADEIFTPDIVFHNPISPDGIHGIEEYKQFALRWYRGFPDRKFTVDDDIVEGNRIAAKFTITGTHLGEFGGHEPTGNPITVRGMNIFIIENQRIKDVEAFFDSVQLSKPISDPPRGG